MEETRTGNSIGHRSVVEQIILIAKLSLSFPDNCSMPKLRTEVENTESGSSPPGGVW